MDKSVFHEDGNYSTQIEEHNGQFQWAAQFHTPASCGASLVFGVASSREEAQKLLSDSVKILFGSANG